MKTLTIIVPTYNMEGYLAACLGSLPSERDDLEVLVIIDGSTDRSKDIAKEYESRCPDVFRVIEKENGQYGSCVNMGLSLASGKYVKILDADDSFSDNCREYLTFLQSCDVDVVFTEWVSVNESGDVLIRSSLNLPSGTVLNLNDLLERGITRIHHYYLTYKTAFLRAIGYTQTEGISYTDLEWDTIPFSRVRTAMYYPKELYHYLRGREGQTVGIEYRSKNMWMENRVVLNLVKYYEDNKAVTDQSNQVFLESVIRFYIIRIYKHYLILYPHQLNISELVDFDEKLEKASGFFYMSVRDDLHVRKYGRFNYIKDFRRHYSRNGITFLYLDFCKFMRKLIKGNS